MERCWSDARVTRPKFAEIIDTIDEIVLEGVIRDKVGVSFWRKNFGTSERVSIQVFARKLLAFCKTKFEGDSSPVYLCLENLLSSGGTVTTESFHVWLQTFGPLRPEAKVISAMVELLKQPWFHGDVATADAERLLATRNVEGTFLVRFSSQPGAYTVSCLRSSRVMHYRATPQGSQLVVGQVTVDSVEQLVVRCKQQLGLAEPLPGSKFQQFFVLAPPSKGAAYLELDTLPAPPENGVDAMYSTHL